MAAAPVVAGRAAAAESADRENIVVTGARIRRAAPPARRDWNACTVNDPDRSLAACRRSLARGAKRDAAGDLAEGLARAWSGDTDGAIAAFDQAIAHDPRLSRAWLNRGLAWQQKGDLDRALADLDRAVAIAPRDPRGYRQRAQLLRQRGETRRAVADDARADDLDDDESPG